MFRKDPPAEYFARRKWSKLLTVKDNNGSNINILDHYIRLSKVEMIESRRTRSPSQAGTVMNMYIALSVKVKMLSSHRNVALDTVEIYQGKTAQIIRTTMKRLDKLHETLKNGLKLKINKFCDYGLKTLTTLTDADGDESQASDKWLPIKNLIAYL